MALKLKPRKVRTATEVKTVYYVKGTCPYTGEYINRTSTRCSRKSDAEIWLTRLLDERKRLAQFGEQSVVALARAVQDFDFPSATQQLRLLQSRSPPEQVH